MRSCACVHVSDLLTASYLCRAHPTLLLSLDMQTSEGKGRRMCCALHVYRPQVSLVQPVSSCGLVVLLVFSHFYLRERLRPSEWCAAGVAFAGVLVRHICCFLCAVSVARTRVSSWAVHGLILSSDVIQFTEHTFECALCTTLRPLPAGCSHTHGATVLPLSRPARLQGMCSCGTITCMCACCLSLSSRVVHARYLIWGFNCCSLPSWAATCVSITLLASHSPSPSLTYLSHSPAPSMIGTLRPLTARAALNSLSQPPPTPSTSLSSLALQQGRRQHARHTYATVQSHTFSCPTGPGSQQRAVPCGDAHPPAPRTHRSRLWGHVRAAGCVKTKPQNAHIM